jgi:hypothetical protein
VNVDLRAVANDFFKFLDALQFAPAGEPRSFGKSLAPFQVERFAMLEPALRALARGDTPPTSRFWWEATKGASKDSDLAAALVWLIAFSAREIVAEVGARDAGQSGELLKAVRTIVRSNAWLNRFVTIHASALLNARTGSRADILSADAPGAHGSRPSLVIVNELTHVGDRTFPETLLDNASKVPNGVAIIATNAGIVGSWQHDWRRIAETSDRWQMHVYDRPAPWISEAEIAEAERRSSRERVARLWRGQWTGASGGAFNEDTISRALTLAGPADRPLAGWTYVAGVDFGFKHDAAAIVVLGRHDGTYEETAPTPKPTRSRLSDILSDLGLIETPTEEFSSESGSAIWTRGTGAIRLIATARFPAGARGTVDAEAFERTLFALNETFRFQRALADPWELRLRIAEWRRRGLPVEELPFTPPNITAATQAVLEAFNERRIELYPCADLLRDLRAAQIEAKSYGEKLSFAKDQFGHGDVGTAYMLATLAASRGGNANAVSGPLLCWPN